MGWCIGEQFKHGNAAASAIACRKSHIAMLLYHAQVLIGSCHCIRPLLPPCPVPCLHPRSWPSPITSTTNNRMLWQHSMHGVWDLTWGKADVTFLPHFVTDSLLLVYPIPNLRSWPSLSTSTTNNRRRYQRSTQKKRRQTAPSNETLLAWTPWCCHTSAQCTRRDSRSLAKLLGSMQRWHHPQDNIRMLPAQGGWAVLGAARLAPLHACVAWQLLGLPVRQ